MNNDDRSIVLRQFQDYVNSDTVPIDPVLKQSLLSSMKSRQCLGVLLDLCKDKLYAYKFDSVPIQWIRLHSIVSILLYLTQEDGRDCSILDHALLVAGEKITIEERAVVDQFLKNQQTHLYTVDTDDDVLVKDVAITSDIRYGMRVVEGFDDMETLAILQQELDTRDPKALEFKQLVSWPACTLWNSKSYLLSKTKEGTRLVPVEIGQTYVSEGWTQKIMPFKDFLNNHVTSNDRQQLGYLAQHNLFQQIPDLRQDFTIPDLCYVDTGFLHNEPLINAWFGPKNTVSPLHTDPHHNIFVQVIGYKYIRIYPDTASNMYAREQENGLDMSNTSSIDLEKEHDEIFRSRFKEFPSDGYVEAVVGPGDAVFIPKGHWHYVKSLSSSFSISFWI